MSETKNKQSIFYRYAVLAVLALALTVFFGKSYESTIPATDTGTYASLSLNATQSGFIPQFPIGAEKNGGYWGKKGFNDQPFLVLSLMGEAMRFFGPTTWSARLVSSAFSVLGILLLLWFGAKTRKPLVGILAAIILIGSRDYLADGVNAHLDNPMTFFIIGSFWAWYGGRFVLAGVLAGIGVWCKSPVALLILPAAFLSSIFEGKFRENILKMIALSVTAIAVGSVVWLVSGFFGGWELVQDYWMRQVYGTAVGGRGQVQEHDLLYVWQILRARWTPWVYLFPIGLVLAPLQGRLRARSFTLPLSAVLILTLVISLMRFKYGHYFVPALPFAALIAAEPLALVLGYVEEFFYQALLVGSLLGVTFLLCYPISLSPESFPAVKRFSALIQSYGKCSDHVLVLEGGEPYGNFDDYKPELEFYTGRKVESVTCENVSARAVDAPWLILTRFSLENCLDQDAHASFSSSFQLGSQFLLSRLIPVTQKVDLTPLERELRAPLDCQAAPLPKDRYHSY